jgi:pyruvate/2-oxoglutarate/acetoin dehydrogenase E1 component
LSLTCVESLNRALRDACDEDPRVILIGEDLLDPYGGAFKVARGLSTAFPERVITTPICEASIVGVATGLALRGFRPVAEIMFGDFLFLAADQIVNHAAKFPSMYNLELPLVVRTPMGGGRGYGPTHSQSLEKHFLGVPGLSVAAPSCFHDAGAMLRTALTKTNPVLFVEHKLLYPEPLRLSGEGALHRREQAEASGFPTVFLANHGKGDPDLTLITYGGTSRFLPRLLSTLAEEEIRVVACVPGSLSPLPLESIRGAAARTGKAVIAEEGTAGFGWGAEVAAALAETIPDRLRLRRVASGESVVPASRRLEEEMLLSSDRILAAVLEVLA